MRKTILITGATDGIGLETARQLAKAKHTLLLHGRSPQKLQDISTELSTLTRVKSYVADLSNLDAVKTFAQQVKEHYSSLDVLINNAGVLKVSPSTLPNGHDLRFVVNTFAPYLLTQALLSLMNPKGRVVNLSSAAQSTVNLDALKGGVSHMEQMDAYSQSKLAITMLSRGMADQLGINGPSIIAVNPGSLLGSKMVKEGFGIAGKDLSIGAEVLVRAALSDEFSGASGKYFDNDSGHFVDSHQDLLDREKISRLMEAVDEEIKPYL